MPVESFSQDVYTGTLQEFLGLKPKWRVSVVAMVMRARRLSLITERQDNRLWPLISRNGWRKSEPFDDRWTPEQPVLLRRSFELMLDERVVSADSIIDAIEIAPTDIEELTGLPRGTISDGPVPIAFRGNSPDGSRTEDNIVALRR
jgi:Zn-dependent peptidase ImmA (M78 family)